MPADYFAPIDRIGSNYTPSAKSLTMDRAKQISHSLETSSDRERRHRKRKDNAPTVMHVTAPAAAATSAHLQQYVSSELRTLHNTRELHPTATASASETPAPEGQGQGQPLLQPEPEALGSTLARGREGPPAEHAAVLTAHATRVQNRLRRKVTNTIQVRLTTARPRVTVSNHAIRPWLAQTTPGFASRGKRGWKPFNSEQWDPAVLNKKASNAPQPNQEDRRQVAPTRDVQAEALKYDESIANYWRQIEIKLIHGCNNSAGEGNISGAPESCRC
jgi:hypothetical protein